MKCNSRCHASSTACLNHDQCDQDVAGVLPAFGDISDDEEDNIPAPPATPTVTAAPAAAANAIVPEGIIVGKRRRIPKKM